MNRPLISIIIPLYNAENYIKETVQSVLNQSYKNIEIIIIDDFSTDNSFTITNNIKSDKITLVKNKKKGACAARNYGFEISKGDYIQYLDADDIISDNKIESQYDLLKDHDENSIASCGWIRFANKIDNLFVKAQETNKSYANPIDWIVDSFNDKGSGQTSIWLSSRYLIQKAKGWDESLTVNQDGDFFCRVLTNASKILYSKKAIVYYRKGNPFSISQRKITQEKAEMVLKSYKMYEETLSKELVNKNIRRALGNNYLRFLYIYDRFFPQLSSTAWKYFYKLEIGKPWPVGGNNFKIIATIIGFKNTLKIAKIIHKLSNKKN